MNTELKTRPTTTPEIARPAPARALASGPQPQPVLALEQTPLMAAFQSAGVGVDRRIAQQRTFEWFRTGATACARGLQ